MRFVKRNGFWMMAVLLVPTSVSAADVDFAGCCFQKRKLTLRNVPPDAGNPQWLRTTFTLTQNSDGLRLKP